MEVPNCLTSCQDPKCQDSDHIRDIDGYVKSLLTSIDESAKETIPLKGGNNHRKPGGQRKALAGWKEFVEPFQKNAQFWHAIWLSAGKPINTELHSIMKRTRNCFHYQVRRCRRVENFLVNQKIIENCIQDDKDLFKEIKKHRGAGNQEELVIDGAIGEQIPEKFATKSICAPLRKL